MRYEVKNDLSRSHETRSAVRREHWSDGARGPRKVPEARGAGEAPQTGPKATFWGTIAAIIFFGNEYYENKKRNIEKRKE